MNKLLKLEELALFILGIFLFSQLDFAWWWFLVLLLAPDISMLGYAIDNKKGALIYNLFHHRGVAVFLYLSGVYFGHELLSLTGVILFSHSALDRMLGYGLKFPDAFGHTHLGMIGKNTDN